MAPTPNERIHPNDRPSTSISTVAHTVAHYERKLYNLLIEEFGLFHPDSRFIARWDLILLVALLFTATVTPYEVAFVEPEINAMFFVNRAVDFLFLTDIMINFRVMYTDDDGKMVKDKMNIALRYLKSGFSVDLLSIIPFDTVKYWVNGMSGTAQRGFRLFRLLKLLRLVRAARIVRRWELKLGYKNVDIQSLKIVVAIATASHWVACTWGLLAFIQAETTSTWLTTWLDGQSDIEDRCTTQHGAADLHANGAFREDCFEPHAMYTACMHFSMMTITSIGYGDIVPTNTTEYGVCCVLMLGSGVTWAMVISKLSGIAALSDPVTRQYLQKSDDINRFMDATKCKSDFKQMVRSYLYRQKSAMHHQQEKQVVKMLSPSLQGRLTPKIRFLRERMIFWMQDCSGPLQAAVATGFETQVFPPFEIIPCQGRMFVLQKGTTFIQTHHQAIPKVTGRRRSFCGLDVVEEQKAREDHQDMLHNTPG
jgi:potassium voltage-gated channel Eag-related subfamily H protein 7